MRWRLGIAAAAVLAVAGGLVFTFASGSGSQSQVTLDGVPDAALADAGVQVLPPDRDPGIDSTEAETFAKQNAPAGSGAEVKEAVLVRVAKDGTQPPINHLAWALNYDPLTIKAKAPSAPAGFSHEGKWCPNPLYFVAFIDATSGQFLFAMERSGLFEHETTADCPA